MTWRRKVHWGQDLCGGLVPGFQAGEAGDNARFLQGIAKPFGLVAPGRPEAIVLEGGSGRASVADALAGGHHPKSSARQGKPETGPWKRFVENAYDALSRQPRYIYMLFSGIEVAAAATLPDSHIMQSLRFGSTGDLVHKAQECLIAKGMPLEVPDGDFGRATIEAVMAFQTREFGRGSADGVIGSNTAQALGFSLPMLGDI